MADAGMRPVLQRPRTQDSLKAAKAVAIASVQHAADRMLPPVPGVARQALGAELLAEARYACQRGAHVSDCVLLTAYTDRDKPSLTELRRAAATVIGKAYEWKKHVAAIQRVAWRAELAISRAHNVAIVYECRDEALEELDKVDLPD